MEVDIAYIISHGFAARMVTQTNLLGKLVQAGKKVALISPDQDDANLKLYCKEKGVELYEFNPSSSFWTSQYSESRKYFLEDIDLNIVLKEKHIRAIKFNKSINPWNHIRPRILYLIYKLIKKFPFIRNWYKLREQSHLNTHVAIELLNLINPKILIATYPINLCEAMLLKAGNNRSSTKTIIHLLSWDNITCKGHFPVLADEYIAWGTIMKDEFLLYYNIDPSKIHICGVPHFDIHYEIKNSRSFSNYNATLGLDPKLPYIFYAMSAQRFVPYEIEILEWLAQRIENNYFGENLNLVIRPHPQNISGNMTEPDWKVRLNKLVSQRVKLNLPNMANSNLPWSIEFEDMQMLSGLMNGALLCVNAGSTISIEFVGIGKPVILSSFDSDKVIDYWNSAVRHLDSPHLQKFVNFEACDIAKSYNELGGFIRTYLNSSNTIDTEKFTLCYESFAFKFDGESTNRVVSVLLNSK